MLEREAPRRQPHQITDVVIWNLGPIELLKLQPQPDWTVFHGENGTGKTTIVDAIESALAARALADLAAQGPAPLSLRPAQLRNDEPEGGVIIRTDSGDSRQRTIGEHGNATLRLADGAEAGRNAPWARFGHGGIDRGRPTESELRAERIEALAAEGSPRVRRHRKAPAPGIRNNALCRCCTGRSRERSSSGRRRARSS